MRIVFNRCMTQRYRTILHLIDPIIEAGHELVIVVSDRSVDINNLFRMPCDASRSAPNTLTYLMDCFGIDIKHFDKVKFTREKNPKADLRLCYDDHNDDALGIPYVTNHCFWKGKSFLVGNPAHAALRQSQKRWSDRFTESNKRALLLHPGGGRGYVSPQRKKMSKDEITANNIDLIQKTINALPNCIEEVVIKTHPFPYKRCSSKAIKNHVSPNLVTDRRVVVVDTRLFDMIAMCMYVINYGGTTSLWCIGSNRQWFNIKGMDKYKAKREKLIDTRGGGIELKDLKTAKRLPSAEAKKVFDMDSISNIMGMIDDCKP